MDTDFMQIALASQQTWQAGFEQGKLAGMRAAFEAASKAAEEKGYPVFAEELRKLKRGVPA